MSPPTSGAFLPMRSDTAPIGIDTPSSVTPKDANSSPIIVGDAPRRRDHEADRRGGAVRGNRLADHAAAVADVAAAEDRAVAVEELGVPSSLGHTDAVVAARHGSEVEDHHQTIVTVACKPKHREDA